MQNFIKLPRLSAYLQTIRNAYSKDPVGTHCTRKNSINMISSLQLVSPKEIRYWAAMGSIIGAVKSGIGTVEAA